MSVENKEAQVLTEGWLHRQHATEALCVNCGVQENSAQALDSCMGTWLHFFSDVSRIRLTCQYDVDMDLQSKSERMANRWPFGRRALQ